MGGLLSGHKKGAREGRADAGQLGPPWAPVGLAGPLETTLAPGRARADRVQYWRWGGQDLGLPQEQVGFLSMVRHRDHCDPTEVSVNLRKVPDIRQRDHPLGRSDRDGTWENRRFLGELRAQGKIRSDRGCRKSRPTQGFLGVSGDHRADGQDPIGVRNRWISEFSPCSCDPGARQADQIPEDLRNLAEIPMVRSAGGDLVGEGSAKIPRISATSAGSDQIVRRGDRARSASFRGNCAILIAVGAIW